MKNKKQWIFAACVVLVLLLVIFTVYQKSAGGNGLAADQQSATEYTSEASADKTNKDTGENSTAKSDDHAEAVTVEDVIGNGDKTSSDDQQVTAAEGSADPGQTTEEETGDSVVITIPDGMAIGDPDD